MRLTAETFGEIEAGDIVLANDNEPTILADGWYGERLALLGTMKTAVDAALEPVPQK